MKTIISKQTADIAANTQPSVRWALASLSLTVLLSSLGTSIANVALPNLVEVFNASFQDVQWVVLAYLLAITSLILSIGRLGDLLGRRRLLLAGLGLFTLASVLCGIAASLWLLIGARLLQGVGAAAMMALTMAFIGETVPKEKTGSAMGLLGTMSAMGTALGPSLGGLLVASLGWQSIFFINLPLGVLAIVLAWRYLPVDRPLSKNHRPRFDHVGTLLLTFTLSAYALAMTLGRGNFGPFNLLLLLVSGFSACLFVLTQTKAISPLIRLAIFRAPLLSAGFIASTLVATVIMATLIVGPFYLAGALALDPVRIGLVMSSGPIVSALAGLPAGRLVDRFGAYRLSIAGLVAMLIGTVALSILPISFGIPGYITPLVITTLGYAFFQAANNTGVMANAQAEERGAISGLLNLSRNVGLITGASLMGAVFAFASTTGDISTTHVDAIATGMHITFALAAALILVAIGIALIARRLSQRACA